MTDHLPAYDLGHWRAQVPLLERFIPMNNCSQAPQAAATRAAAVGYLDSWNRSGMDWDAWLGEVQGARAAFARLVNAHPDDVAVFSSVSEAASAVASALDFGGERCGVVASEAEFPSIGHVWMAQERRGARVTWAPLRDGTVDPGAWDALVDARTALVSACHGYYLNGALQDVARIARLAHAHGALLFVDAYQTLGAVPLDAQACGADFIASGNLKYLMGIPGIAFLHVRPDVVERLHPSVTGWFGRVNPFAFDPRGLDWAPGARRFDTGTPPLINAAVARAGMDMILEIGMPAIGDWHRVLSRRLLEGAAARGLATHGPADVDAKTASTAFPVPDSHAVEAAMRARGIIASARGPVLRLAPHFYSTEADVDSALDALAGIVAPR